MSVINKLDFPESKFSLYFLAFDSAKAESHGKHWTDREGVLELTHNYGTEADPNYKVANGNTEPGRGFGHVAFSVDNIHAACEQLETNGVAFQKKLSEGRMRNIAFALDPDGYWVELVSQKKEGEEQAEEKTTEKETYRFNHTMIRCKDPEKSLQFYQSTLGMSLLRTVENPDGKFNLYFLGYRRPEETGEVTKEMLAGREGVSYPPPPLFTNPVAKRDGSWSS
jgi:lactoylglutathione lyase